jgi:hypothetical protein
VTRVFELSPAPAPGLTTTRQRSRAPR